MSAWLSLHNVSIAYNQKRVVNQCNFSLQQGDILSFLGPSGCGKSTILKAIAGLISIEAGCIRLHDNIIADHNTHTAPQERNIGMIFQDYALFPHLTAQQNIAFGLKHLNKSERQTQVERMLETVGLSELAKRYPHELSGGQQQRVAIARALAREPDLLLLDEAFSNLDSAVRHRLIDELRQLFIEQKTTAIFVTHDKNEAFALADHIAIMDAGTIAQIDSPRALYDHPVDQAIANFLGHGSIVRFQKTTDSLSCSLGDYPNTLSDTLMTQQETTDWIELLLRPHHISLHIGGDRSNGEIECVRFRGDYCLYDIHLTDQSIQLISKQRLHVGQKVCVQLNM